MSALKKGRAYFRSVSVVALAASLVALSAASCASARAPVSASPDGKEPAKEAIAKGATGDTKVDDLAARSADGTSAPSTSPAKPSAVPAAVPSEADSAAPSTEKRDSLFARPSESKLGSVSSSVAGVQAQSGLKAGYADDNKQFNYFVDFLAKFSHIPHYELAVHERIVIQVRDAKDRPVANAAVRITSGGRTVATGLTYADGSFSLYPLEIGKGSERSYEIEAKSAAGVARAEVDRAGPRSVVLRLGSERKVAEPLPVDVLFTLDTTGSMGEEIERLRATIEIIEANISALKPRPDLRFGMVLYKDKSDEYVTRVVPFTEDLGTFRKALNEIYAEGGGDDPEDLQAALDKAIRGMTWDSGGIRLGFIITDAAAHLDYGQAYTYAEAARDAKKAGIKLFSIGVGGLPPEGEYVLRQIAQYTQGRYIFLTYGEKGESEGGREASVSHHTGSNWAADKLESIVIRFVKEEIAWQSDRILAQDEEYYSAKKVEDESKELILGKLFAKALGDLSNYSSMRMDKKTRCAIMPIAPVAGPGSGLAPAAQAEYFGSALTMAAAESGLFTLVERKDMQRILAELELQLSGLADEQSAAKVGRLMGAEVLVAGTLFERDGAYELFLKLLRVETAEVLSVVKARIERELGL